MIRWGTVTTTNAPLKQILEFAAWHLELGAHRILIYLDDDAPEAMATLSAHPKLRVFRTDAAWWAKRNGRPAKHQVRQGANARHANNRKPDCDWLAHIDVDEFLLPQIPIADQLADLPDQCLCARVRPVEALAPTANSAEKEHLFKAFHLDQGPRQRAALTCFPNWGAHLSGGFLSHVAGKLFFRPATKGLQIRIHNIELGGGANPGEEALLRTELGHFHAASWAHFRDLYRFRMARGSYRAELKPQVRQTPGKAQAQPVNLHELFTLIEAEGGEEALHLFYTEVCTATPDLTRKLSQEGLLRRARMDLERLRRAHFG